MRSIVGQQLGHLGPLVVVLALVTACGGASLPPRSDAVGADVLGTDAHHVDVPLTPADALPRTDEGPAVDVPGPRPDVPGSDVVTPRCGDGTCAEDETCRGCSADCGECPRCGDGTCNPGEGCETCADDCGACTRCGDGACNGDETCDTCVDDCQCDRCGDGTCAATEGCAACVADCGACPACDDGTCNGNETCADCPSDCGRCSPPPGAGDLVVSEILYDPAAVADGAGEWFELHNPSLDETYVLDGCAIADRAGDSHTITALTMAPGAWQVFARAADANGGLPPAYVYGNALNLNNDGETLSLTCGGVKVDEIVFGGAGWPTARGKALSLSSDALSAALNDDVARWCLATAAYGDGDLGTPGGPNPPCALPPSCGDGTCSGEETCTTCERDCGACPPLPARGAVVITELMVDPSKVADTAGEWIEIVNPGSAEVRLEGCLVADAGATHTIRGLVVPAGGYQVLARRTDANGGLPGTVYVYGSGLNLNNDADTVSIRCGDVVVDEVAYGTGWPIASGVSMSLAPDAIHPDDNADPSRWCQPAATYGDGDRGTPGAANPVCAP